MSKERIINQASESLFSSALCSVLEWIGSGKRQKTTDWRDATAEDQISFAVSLFHTLQPNYKMVHYKTVLDIRWFKARPQKCYIQTKMFRLYRKKAIMVIFMSPPFSVIVGGGI